MIRRISTKWVLTVLAAVVIPFLGFTWYVDQRIGSRQSWDVVRYFMLSMAEDLATRVDEELRERRLDVELWAEDPNVEYALSKLGGKVLNLQVEDRINRYIEKSSDFDLVLAIDTDGRAVVSNTVDRDGTAWSKDRRRTFANHDFTTEDWFHRALAGEIVLVDQHRPTLLYPGPEDAEVRPSEYAVGIAAPVRSVDGAGSTGVVYALFNWEHIQHGILDSKNPESSGIRGLIGSDLYASSYAWLWKADADTILGHNVTSLYGQRVSQPPIDLPQLTRAAASSEWGMYPEYQFRGAWKNAAYKHCAPISEGGLGWIVGIGIDNDDIYAAVGEMRRVLIKASVLVLGVVALVTVFIARRTTRPILELERHTRRVAGGDLEARIEVTSKDELGQLAEAFNNMTQELSANRTRLIQAEKEAAWREMARQVAHEIKNPLTPIQLSVTLLKRAHDEGSPEFESILGRTTEMVQRQVEVMRRIAGDFHAFAGEQQPEPRPVDPAVVLEEVLSLNAAWAADLGVSMRIEGEGALVFADPAELQRVFVNLVQNALEAMPDGGELVARFMQRSGRLRLELTDDGVGLTPETRERLFEPYFTTRTHGTGLGLAICRRIVTELGGELALNSRKDARGTTAVIELPIMEPST
jgi:signal transduction histidine kinase